GGQGSDVTLVCLVGQGEIKSTLQEYQPSARVEIKRGAYRAGENAPREVFGGIRQRIYFGVLGVMVRVVRGMRLCEKASNVVQQLPVLIEVRCCSHRLVGPCLGLGLAGGGHVRGEREHRLDQCGASLVDNVVTVRGCDPGLSAVESICVPAVP